MTKERIVALEEHYWTPALRDRYTGPHRVAGHHPARKLDDLGAVRLQDMDEAGIDLQIISHMQPGTQLLDPESAVRLAREANDTLHRAILGHPGRFAGFAELPTPDPKAAADELERAVTRLGFKGVLVNGLTHGLFLDDKRFWPIFERAEALDVPIYLHPAVPHPAAMDAYYNDYPNASGFPQLAVLWGFTAETALQAVRLIVSGVFDAYPKLTFILGHLGETLPFMLWRCDWLYNLTSGKSGFAQCFRERFYITTSGNFSQPALECCLKEVGADRILFSVDYPFNSNAEGVAFIRAAALDDAARAKIFHGNATRLLRL
jgi:2,3-dihydroxybenzoate decarboxylase